MYFYAHTLPKYKIPGLLWSLHISLWNSKLYFFQIHLYISWIGITSTAIVENLLKKWSLYKTYYVCNETGAYLVLMQRVSECDGFIYLTSIQIMLKVSYSGHKVYWQFNTMIYVVFIRNCFLTSFLSRCMIILRVSLFRMCLRHQVVYFLRISF